MTHFEMVKKWHEAFGVPIKNIPDIMFNNRVELRKNLIKEEVFEFIDGCENEDIENVAKELCDILYVVYGTALEFGLTHIFDKCFKEVHRSNMSKLDVNGKPVLRHDGKVLKSELYTPADLSKIFKEYHQ